MDWSLMFNKRVVVYGCGNILKGDDGAGPMIVKMLDEAGDMPDDVGLLDVGTSIKQVLFDMVVMDPKPERIVVVDATTKDDRKPGEFWEVDVDEIIPKKVKDYSFHLFPSVNLLKEIRDETSVDVKIVVVQTKYIPDELDETISEEVQAALPGICDTVRKWCTEPVN